MTEIVLELPWPPSINGLYTAIIHHGSRHPRLVLSKKGRDYKLAVKLVCQTKLHQWPEFEKQVAVTVTLYPPTRAKFDLDGRMKALLDALTEAKCWEDDSQIDELTIRRGGVSKGGLALVCVKQFAKTSLPSEP